MATDDRGVPRIGVSECLVGRTVRYDGGHKRSAFVCESLAPFVDLVPVCPEVEVGMGVPRESLRLVGEADRVAMIGNKTGTDFTDRMNGWAERRVGELAAIDLDGYVLKKDSPSCGLERVKLYTVGDGAPGRSGTGLYAAALRRGLPGVPLTEDGFLQDPGRRNNFLEQVFTHHRLRTGLAADTRPSKLVELHAAHKFLYMAHSPTRQTALGRIVAGAGDRPLADIAPEYTRAAMETLAIPTTPGKHTNVLHHILGFFKDVITADEKAEVIELVDDYRAGAHALAVPVAVLAHHLRRHGVGGWLADQVYFEPYPRRINAR